MPTSTTDLSQLVLEYVWRLRARPSPSPHAAFVACVWRVIHEHPALFEPYRPAVEDDLGEVLNARTARRRPRDPDSDSDNTQHGPSRGASELGTRASRASNDEVGSAWLEGAGGSSQDTASTEVSDSSAGEPEAATTLVATPLEPAGAIATADTCPSAGVESVPGRRGPDVAPRARYPRRRFELQASGLTPGCAACRAVELDMPVTGLRHTDVRRARVEALLANQASARSSEGAPGEPAGSSGAPLSLSHLVNGGCCQRIDIIFGTSLGAVSTRKRSAVVSIVKWRRWLAVSCVLYVVCYAAWALCYVLWIVMRVRVVGVVLNVVRSL